MLPEILDAKALISTGICPDLHPDQDYFWEDARNVVIASKGVRKMAGWRKLGTAINSYPLRGMEAALDLSGNKYLFFGDWQKLFRWNGASITNVTRVSGNYTGFQDAGGVHTASAWSMVNWGAWIIATNGVDPIQIYRIGSDSNFIGLNSLGDFDCPARAEILVKAGQHIVAFNTDEGATAYEWSDEDDPTTWIPSASNGAGGNVIRDFDSPIRAACKLGDRTAIYGDNQLALMTYLGTPLYFGVNKALQGIGAFGKNSVVSVDRRNYGFGKQGFFVTDGAQSKPIDEGRIRDLVLDEVNLEQISKVNAVHKARTGEVIWYYPTGTNLEPTKAAVYNYLRDGWTFLDHGKTCSIPARIYDVPYSGNSSGELLEELYGADANTSALSAYIQTKALHFGKIDGVKFIESVRAATQDVTGLVYLSVGWKMELADDWNWHKLLLQSDSKLPHYITVSARWFCFKIHSDELGAEWELNNLSVTGEVVGESD